MEQKIARMKELAATLNTAARAYYQESREIMSNFEYDKLYDELQALEQETGIVVAGSPTAFVGYEVLSDLPKETHASPMLSLDKTKEVAQLQSFLGSQKGLLSWKLDGLTIVLTYQDGVLQKAVTRGNGEVGEVVTSNARTFVNLPQRIPYQGRLVVRGEALITYSDFAKTNERIEEEADRYKNPRNLCAGSVRQLNSEVTASRNVRIYIFGLIEAENVDFENSHYAQFLWLKQQGFDVVEMKQVCAWPGQMEDCMGIEEAVAQFGEQVTSFDLPSDGLVLLMDDIAYGESLGRTAKFPRNAMAFKWKDETAETTLRAIHWSPSRTGLINPVAVFDPVELEGTTVTRASVHNLSIMEALELGVGDQITVYKANMIIPQIGENLTRSGHLEIPSVCPVCGGTTEIRNVNEVKSLYCTNPDCQAKKIKSFELFVSRDAMNIDGLSGATMEKLIDAGFVHTYSDLFHLDRYQDQIVEMEGFGAKSYENMIASVEKSRQTTLARLIYSLGIPGIGSATAKLLCKAFDNDYMRLMEAQPEQLQEVDGVGSVLADGFHGFWQKEDNREMLNRLLQEVELQAETKTEDALLYAGKTFVITGSVTQFPNRNAMKAYIEERGGKVSSAVSSKTNYLINNDVTSSSSKNKKARELGIPILSEEDLLSWKE